MNLDEKAKKELLNGKVIRGTNELDIHFGKYAIIINNNNEENKPAISILYYDENRDEYDIYIEEYLN